MTVRNVIPLRDVPSSREAARAATAPVVATLSLFGQWMDRAYRADIDDDRLWHASCPVCLTRDAVIIRELTGGVHVACNGPLRCSKAEILTTLRDLVVHRDPWASADEWRRIAEDLYSVACDLSAQLDRALNRPRERRAA